MRGDAIRNAMRAYIFTDDEIESTVSSAGYRAGGRVDLDLVVWKPLINRR